ncbi:unnamed protein product [Caenorhabditis angaria]|uniref:PPM-type phosphatase domain-containing protein n=1 Tax=Caenorhabditis angaria TaxID=860376 RepID=A0A9P1MYK5_9PELO|nr:unnamed protein product [Caenorhabditis angaria]
MYPKIPSLMAKKIFAVIACDGLWKSFSNQEVIDFVQEKMENLKSLDLELQPNESREEAEIRQISDFLAAEAVRRKCGDNVSIIIVKF